MHHRFRRLVVIVVAIGAVLIATACGSEAETDAARPVGAEDPSPDAVTGATEGEWPHDFQAALVGGGTLDAGDYAGQDLVLWFWAPW